MSKFFTEEDRRDLARERAWVSSTLEEFFPDNLLEAVSALRAMSEVHEKVHQAIEVYRALTKGAQEDPDAPPGMEDTLEMALRAEEIKHVAIADLHNRMMEAAISMEDEVEDSAPEERSEMNESLGRRCGISSSAVKELFDAGWVYEEKIDSPARWLSPETQLKHVQE